jgi:hypothetical protein
VGVGDQFVSPDQPGTSGNLIVKVVAFNTLPSRGQLLTSPSLILRRRG